ncbi:MAG: hypothetical protein PHW93_01450 [Candidatus Methanomethylophilaceae archaeon]|nr:hypothetical protein [Candidatus Methanomethylophilaceae archaeon]
MERLRGRPNQGKTETIRERCVNVYLPTMELVQDWKKDAENAGMPVSRYVFEVVERHRHSQAANITPNWQLEERTKDLENRLAAVQSKYDILNLAFQRREEDVRRLNDELSKASKVSVDTRIVGKLVEIISRRNGETVTMLDVSDELGVDKMTDEEIAQVREAQTLLKDIGLIESDGFIGWRWKVGERKRPKLSSAAKHRRRQR